MKKEMLINVLQAEECRIAILEDGVLEELYVERTSHESYVGNIYKGRIVNIEPSIQAAFVDFGVGRNGFLHVSDVEPEYYRHLEGYRDDRGRGRDRGRDRPAERGHDRGRDRDRGRGGQGHRMSVPIPPPSRAEDEPRQAREQEPEESEGFGRGLDLEPEPQRQEATEQPTEQAPEQPRAEARPEAAPASQGEPLEASPETRIEEEEEAPRTRRRSRGDHARGAGRRKRGSSTEAAEETAKAPEEAAESEEPEGGEPPDEPRPRLMDSAEHRTSPDDEKGSAEEDDLLFFPREPEPAAAAPHAEHEPLAGPEEHEPEPPEPPQEEAGVEEVEGPEEPEEQFKPRRPRRDVRSPASIEEALEEDLAAAEIGPAWDTAEQTPAGYPMPLADEQVEMEVDEEVVVPHPRPEGRGERRDRRDRDHGRGGRDRGRGEHGRGGRHGRRGPGGGGGPRQGFGRPKPPIQEIFKRGQEVLVQVIKEGIGTKGPTLSTYISIPGRYLVLMPGLNRVGVSRKIEDEEARRHLRDIFHELKPPRGLGFIIRTAGIDKNKKELQRDLAYLTRVWQVVYRRTKKLKSPAEIYQESDMITRTIRDTFTADIDTIWVDEPGAYERAKEFLQIVMPRYANRIQLYEGKEPLFHKYGIEDEIARIQLKKVPLPNGGSIVIEQTEALVAIDVNSGNFRADNNAEETAFQMNLQAAKEIARQLRLRDLGGVIVNDFIDMRDEKHRRTVEKALRDAVKRDRARTKILKTSAFGIIEMTRQRIRPSLKRSVYMDCPYCHGHGQVKTSESMSIEVMRMLQLAAHRENVQRIDVRVTEEVAAYLLNNKRKEVAKLEQDNNITITITGARGVPPETLEFVCLDKNNNEVRIFGEAPRTRR